MDGSMRPRPWFLLSLLAALWAAGVSAGFFLLDRYAAAPGEGGQPPPSWPRGSRIPLATDRPTLVLFAHPKCPCTRATIGELAAVMTHARDRLSARVLFYKP